MLIPLQPQSLGKGRDEYFKKPSYRNPKESEEYGWGYSPAHLIPNITVQFEDNKGNIIKTNYPLLLDLPKIELSPGGYIPGTCLFNTPKKAGTYNIRFIIDNTKLQENTGFNSNDFDVKGKEVFFRKEILLEDIEIK